MTSSITLLTIITEGILRDEIIAIILKHGATGYTYSRAEGHGSRGNRATDWEGPNLRFESLVSQKVAESILNDLDKDYFENYSVVAWVSQVNVLRREKFLRD
jgi:nitrogen regulatory protein P-II 2